MEEMDALGRVYSEDELGQGCHSRHRRNNYSSRYEENDEAKGMWIHFDGKWLNRLLGVDVVDSDAIGSQFNC